MKINEMLIGISNVLMSYDFLSDTFFQFYRDKIRLELPSRTTQTTKIIKRKVMQLGIYKDSKIKIAFFEY